MNYKITNSHKNTPYVHFYIKFIAYIPFAEFKIKRSNALSATCQQRRQRFI